MNSLLVELLTEELPPKALKKLGEAFASGIAQGLAVRKLTGADAVVTSFATPRRLAVHITRVAAQSPEQARRDKVLPVAVAFAADGKPQAPLLKKLAALGLTEADAPKLERAMDGKAEALFYSFTAPGQPLAAGLQEVLSEAIGKLPIPKVMFYERDDGTAVNFVRPAHKLIALHGSDVVPCGVLGVHAGRETFGHRFHSNGALLIASADSYVETLNKAHVIASYAERRASIEKQLNALAKGDEIIAPDALLDEVTSLVEWPCVYECHFEKEFLEVPQECLILTMQTNQKYFATQKNGKLTNRFLIVSNIDTKDPSLIISGNERVVRPRLADAKFFFDQDRKHTLESRLPKLANVVYHGKLGSQADRNARVTAIAVQLAKLLGADVEKVERAAKLSKADLLTDMVGEFPELQGIMGTYYAKHDGEDAEVAQAITEHYQPKFAGDALPATPTGTVLALADKLETLAGMFGTGQLPTGDKDPFALRRHAIGLIRLIVDSEFKAHTKEEPTPVALVGVAFSQFALEVQNNDTSKDQLIGFFWDRLCVMQKEAGYAAQAVDSVRAKAQESIRADGDEKNLRRLSQMHARLDAVSAFMRLAEAEPLAAANKRIGNILKKSNMAIGAVDPSLFQEEAEKHLFGALKSAEDAATPLFHNGEYAASLRELASLRGPVDAFFDKVMVNADDPKLKANRLALLQTLHTAMNRVADLSKLAA